MTVFVLLILLILGLSRSRTYPKYQSFTYIADITNSLTDDVAIIGSDLCEPSIGFIENGANQTFDCVFYDETDEYNNALTFNYPIQKFPEEQFISCFTSDYSGDGKGQTISSCTSA